MASNDEMQNVDECYNASKSDEMELILFTVGTFGNDGALLEDIQGIQKLFSFSECISILNFFLQFVCSEIYTNLPS